MVTRLLQEKGNLESSKNDLDLADRSNLGLFFKTVKGSGLHPFCMRNVTPPGFRLATGNPVVEDAHAPCCRVTAEGGFSLMNEDGKIDDVYDGYKPEELDEGTWYEITQNLHRNNFTYKYIDHNKYKNIRLRRPKRTNEEKEINDEKWEKITIGVAIDIIKKVMEKRKKEKKAEDLKKDEKRKNRKILHKYNKGNKNANKTNDFKKLDCDGNEENNEKGKLEQRVIKIIEKKKKFIKNRMQHILSKLNENLNCNTGIKICKKRIKSLAIKKTITKLKKEHKYEEKYDAIKESNEGNEKQNETKGTVMKVINAIKKDSIIKIASLNPDNASTFENRQIIIEKLNNNNIDIACIQETHDNKDTDTTCGNYYIIRSSEKKEEIENNNGITKAGVAIYIHKYLKNNITNVIRNTGRYIQMTLNGEHFRTPTIIINTYAPNQGYNEEEKKKYWKTICTEMKKNRKLNEVNNEQRINNRIPMIWMTDNNGEIGRGPKEEKIKKCSHAELLRLKKNQIIGKHTRRKNIEPGNGREFFECMKLNNMIEITTQKCCNKCKKENGICKKTATWYHPNGRNNRQIDYIAITEKQKNWIMNVDKTNYASNTSSRQHRMIIAELSRTRGKPINQNKRRAEHIDFDLNAMRSNNDVNKIKLNDQYVKDKILKKYENESTNERIKRIWTSTKKYIRKQIKDNFPKKPKKKVIELNKKEEEIIKTNNEKMNKLKNELESHDEKTERERKNLLLKKAFIGLIAWQRAKKEGVIEEQWNSKHYDLTDDKKVKIKNINKYMYKIPIKYLHNNKKLSKLNPSGTQSNGSRLQKCGADRCGWGKISETPLPPRVANNASSSFEPCIPGRGNGERSKTTAGGVATPHRHTYPFEPRNPGKGDEERSKITVGEVATPHLQAYPSETPLPPGMANNASSPFEPQIPGRGNEERSKITVGGVATPRPHNLIHLKLHSAGGGEQRFTPKPEIHEDTEENCSAWTRTKFCTTKGTYKTNINKYNVIDIVNKHRITFTGDQIIEIEEKNDIRKRIEEIKEANKIYASKMNEIKEIERKNNKIRKIAKHRNIMTKIENFNTDFNNKDPKHTKKIWDFLKCIKKSKENKKTQNFNPIKKKNGELTRTIDENIDRWEQWVKEMFFSEDTTPKTHYYNNEIWRKNEDEIKKNIEINNINDTVQTRKAKNKRNNSELKKILDNNATLNEQLNSEITKEEIRRAIRTLKNNKSFGSDRIPAEIYKENREIMTEVIHEVITGTIKNGDLLNDWTDGIITLLHKKNDKTDTNNYRPICLLNISYKILSIIICQRINPIMNILTRETQTAYKNNRSTLDIISIIDKFTKDASKSKEYKSITLLDLSKAFDRMNRQKLLTVLAEKGLPINMIKIIEIMHRNTQLRPKQNNKLGSSIENNTGCFQGSPLSALVFIIYADEMMEKYEEYLKEIRKKNGTKEKEKRECMKVRSKKNEEEWTTHKTNEMERGNKLNRDEENEENNNDNNNEKIRFEGFKRNTTRNIEADHCEYADDSNLLNNEKNDEIEKGCAYKYASTDYEMLLQLAKTKIVRKGVKEEGNAGLPEPLHEILEIDEEKILGLYLGFDTSRKKLHNDRINKGRNAYNTLACFAKNEHYSKKARFRMAEALIKPIFTYGYTALEKEKRSERRIEIELNKIYRQIEHAEDINKCRKKENENKNEKKKVNYDFERKTNNQIRKINNLRTIESQFIKERAQFSINAKKTNSITYHFNKKSHEENIKNAIEELENIKKNIINNSRITNDMEMIMDENTKNQKENRKRVKTIQMNEIKISCENEECTNHYENKQENNNTNNEQGSNEDNKNENNTKLEIEDEDENERLLREIKEYLENFPEMTQNEEETNSENEENERRSEENRGNPNQTQSANDVTRHSEGSSGECGRRRHGGGEEESPEPNPVILTNRNSIPPGMANNASSPLEPRFPGKENEERGETIVGKVATPSPHPYPSNTTARTNSTITNANANATTNTAITNTTTCTATTTTTNATISVFTTTRNSIPPRMANNASSSFEPHDPGMGSEERSKITVGEVATPHPHNLIHLKLHSAGGGEQRFTPTYDNVTNENKEKKECTKCKNSWRYRKDYEIEEINEKEIIINGRKYERRTKENADQTEKILNTLADIILKQEIQKTLLNKLARTDIKNCKYNELEELLPLILNSKIKGKDDDLDGEEEIEMTKKEKRKRKCEKCNKIYETPGKLKRHLNKNIPCKLWRQKAKNAIKFCDRDDCDFITKDDDKLDIHEEITCKLNKRYNYELENENAKRRRIDCRGIPKNNMMHKDKIRYDEETQKLICTICGRQEEVRDENRMRIHINTKHKEEKIKNQDEIEKDKQKYKRDLENRKESTRKKMRENNENHEQDSTPKPINQMAYLGRIERCIEPNEDNKQTWKCTFQNCNKKYCDLITSKWRGLIAHVARHAQEVHKKQGKKKGDNFLCPYCNGKHGDMKSVLRHLIERNCEQNRCEKYDGKKLWNDFTEANW